MAIDNSIKLNVGSDIGIKVNDNNNVLINRDCFMPHDYDSIIYLYRVEENKRIEEKYCQEKKEYLKSFPQLEEIINIYNEFKKEEKDMFSTDKSIEDFLMANLKIDEIDKGITASKEELERKINKVCALLQMAETYENKKDILTTFGII